VILIHSLGRSLDTQQLRGVAKRSWERFSMEAASELQHDFVLVLEYAVTNESKLDRS